MSHSHTTLQRSAFGLSSNSLWTCTLTHTQSHTCVQVLGFSRQGRPIFLPKSARYTMLLLPFFIRKEDQRTSLLQQNVLARSAYQFERSTPWQG